MVSYPPPDSPHRPLAGLLLRALLLGSGTAGASADIPVVITGPASAPPESDPHMVAVENPIPGVAYQWAVAPGTGTLVAVTPNGASATFRTGPAACAVLTCTAQNRASGEVGAGTHEVLLLVPEPVPIAPPLDPPIQAPAQALVPAVRIGDFTCAPANPDSTTRTATLSWNLEGVLDGLVLREAFTGWEQSLLPTDRFFQINRLQPGRHRYILETILKDQVLKREVTAVRSCDVVVPGIAVLAGDVAHLGSSYMRKAPPDGIAWGSVTGLAWKSPWLYFSQGDQHTVRRVHLAGGDVEEVAGMRGVPGTGRPGQDLLFQPGQLLHRRCTDDCT